MQVCSRNFCTNVVKPRRKRCEMHYQRWHANRHLSKTPIYKVWVSIKARCLNPKDAHYNLYGGRGITVCNEWRDSFLSFRDYIGPKPGAGYSIDRINNDGNYEPGNVRWATQMEQCHNRSTNHWLTLDGQTRTVSEWSRLLCIPKSTIFGRIAKGSNPLAPIDTRFSVKKKAAV